MQDVLEIYDNYNRLGIKNRIITEGKETDLVKEFINYKKEKFQASYSKKLAIFLETKIENSYPDIVFVEYNPDNYSDWNSVRNLVEKDDLKILYQIYVKGGLDATDIVTQLGFSWKKIMIAVEHLNDSNLITRKNKKWILTDEKKISTNNIEAVEAKLNQWGKVLQQSIINKNFASESYALSITQSKPSKDIVSKFKKFGIGICLQNGNGFSILREAKRLDIPVSYNSIIFNEWIGKILMN